ncbi:hypothetical protein [Hymenobacter negativus]|uniref:Uncharacterized protein n=1 Tax=Hymenobacter negativus TaxID=2795026 RepID=A0ABS0Q4Y0_9BACT|nr:hypothetical protein [Hymenobacter negativus]MBH8557403.1 hypothetical protein [Hymenobacter negativus]
MKTAPNPAHPASLADPKIMKTARRDHTPAARFEGFEEVTGEQGHRCLPPFPIVPQVLRLPDFGRPWL